MRVALPIFEAKLQNYAIAVAQNPFGEVGWRRRLDETVVCALFP